MLLLCYYRKYSPGETCTLSDAQGTMKCLVTYRVFHLERLSSRSGAPNYWKMEPNKDDWSLNFVTDIHHLRCDGMFIEVSGESLCDKIIIGTIYRPPRSNNNNKTIKQFCEELTPVISNISKNSCHIIITGDFNIDLLQINERSEFQKYFDLFLTHGLFPNITMPTRCCRSSSSLIDQMFCKLKELKHHSTSFVIKSCISDHFPYISVFDILKKIKTYAKIFQD